MLRFLITVAIIGALWYVGDAINDKFKEIKKQNGAETAPQTPAPAPASADAGLTGMPDRLAPSLQAAQGQGPAAMKKWLDANRRFLQDPKLGDVELDYAVMLSRQNFGAARDIYRQVKSRTPANSPLQSKLKRLAATYE
jgi:hypothetical protein